MTVILTIKETLVPTEMLKHYLHSSAREPMNHLAKSALDLNFLLASLIKRASGVIPVIFRRHVKKTATKYDL